MFSEMDKPAPITQLRGNIPIHHRYTLGVAGERFFKAMRDQKLILASGCSSCNQRFLPPKIYCEQCFVETHDWSPVEGPGYIKTFTLLHRSLEEEPLAQPAAAALIGWHGVRGGLLHRIDGVDLSHLRIGLAVEPRWAEVRVGSINDIQYFCPI